MADASVVTQGHLWDPWGGNLTQTISLGALPRANDCWLSQELQGDRQQGGSMERTGEVTWKEVCCLVVGKLGARACKICVFSGRRA